MNELVFNYLKKKFENKPLIKSKFEDIKKCTKNFFRGKLVIFISDVESYENIRFLINLDLVKSILVYSKDVTKISEILLKSPKYIGYSMDVQEIKNKLEETVKKPIENSLESKLKKNFKTFIYIFIFIFNQFNKI